jgi:hypothetical protein
VFFWSSRTYVPPGEEAVAHDLDVLHQTTRIPDVPVRAVHAGVYDGHPDPVPVVTQLGSDPVRPDGPDALVQQVIELTVRVDGDDAPEREQALELAPRPHNPQHRQHVGAVHRHPYTAYALCLRRGGTSIVGQDGPDLVDAPRPREGLFEHRIHHRASALRLPEAAASSTSARAADRTMVAKLLDDAKIPPVDAGLADDVTAGGSPSHELLPSRGPNIMR